MEAGTRVTLSPFFCRFEPISSSDQQRDREIDVPWSNRSNSSSRSQIALTGAATSAKTVFMKTVGTPGFFAGTHVPPRRASGLFRTGHHRRGRSICGSRSAAGAGPIRSSSSTCRTWATKEEFSFVREIPYEQKRDYLKSAVNIHRRAGLPMTGWDCEVRGTIPINAGTSSSSAMVVAWNKFLLEAAGDPRAHRPHDIAEWGI